MQITPILDTQSIDDSTEQGMRVNITPDPITQDSYTAPDGTVVSGTGLTVTPPLKETSLAQIQNEIDSITRNMAIEQTRLDALNAILPQVQTAVDSTIATAITNGAQDMRSAQVATPPLSEKQ